MVLRRARIRLWITDRGRRQWAMPAARRRGAFEFAVDLMGGAC